LASTVSTAETSKWLVLAIGATATLLGTSDYSIVIIAFPTFAEVFETSTATVVWVALAFQLLTLGLVLPMGRVGDLYGRRRILVIGMGVYTVGLGLAAISPNIYFLISVRALLGVGSAMTGAISVAIVMSAFPSNERGKALGVLASVAGIGLMAGPALGGILLDTLGWRSIFYTRAPVALISLLLAARYLPPSVPTGSTGRMDIRGSVLIFLSLTGVAVGVNQGGDRGWSSPEVIGLLALAVVGMAGFIAHQLHIESPVIDPRMFKRWGFSVANGAHLLFTASTAAMTFLLPFYLVIGKSLSPTLAGLILLTSPGLQALLAPFVGRLSDRFGPRLLTPFGLGISATGLFLVSTLSIDSPISIIIGYFLIVGMGTSLFATPNQSSILGAAPEGRLGTVSALISTTRNIGLITGLATAEAIFTGVAPDVSEAGALVSREPGLSASVVAGMSTTVRVFGSMVTLAMLISLTRGKRQQNPQNEEVR
jgi:EmrB/QacA subfamily drug resistance transporter